MSRRDTLYRVNANIRVLGYDSLTATDETCMLTDGQVVMLLQQVTRQPILSAGETKTMPAIRVLTQDGQSLWIDLVGRSLTNVLRPL